MMEYTWTARVMVSPLPSFLYAINVTLFAYKREQIRFNSEAVHFNFLVSRLDYLFTRRILRSLILGRFFRRLARLLRSFGWLRTQFRNASHTVLLFPLLMLFIKVLFLTHTCFFLAEVFLFFPADCFLVGCLHLSLLRFASVVDELRVASGSLFFAGSRRHRTMVLYHSFLCVSGSKSSRSLFVVGGLSSADACPDVCVWDRY